MDKKLNKKNERTDKTVDRRNVKDHGDTFRKNNNKIDLQKSPVADRGDSAKNISNDAEKPKVKPNEKKKFKSKIDDMEDKEVRQKENKLLAERLEERKRIREKYTVVKPKFINHITANNGNGNIKDDLKCDIKMVDGPLKNSNSDESSKPKEKLKQIESSNNSGKSDNISDQKLEKEPTMVRRKPIIKTITTKNKTTRIFKAVTFVDQKQQPTPLQIKIPTERPKKTISKLTDTSSLKIKSKSTSKASLKEKSIIKKRIEKKHNRTKHNPSPKHSVIKESISPPTEVAKWAPSCINEHTKPYYEAWVNTTLAAISRNSKNDKLFLEQQNIIHTFQRALDERPATPDLIYENFSDERYTGKIKIRQR